MSKLKLFLSNNFIFFKLSLSELRGSFNEFKIVITSIFLGVFIISAVGSLSENLKYEINDKRTELIEVNLNYLPLTKSFLKAL